MVSDGPCQLSKLTALRIGDLVARIPIIQGGMGVGISWSGLSAAVANEGGIGGIATAGISMMEPDFFSDFLAANRRALRREIRKARTATSGILAVNIVVALTNYADLVGAALEEEIDIIFSGTGLPLNLPGLLPKESATKLVPIVSSGRAAALLCKRWTERFGYRPDAIVVEGPRAVISASRRNRFSTRRLRWKSWSPTLLRPYGRSPKRAAKPCP
jgi:NAD(P)H-dependent flavin oxidoreductase YrpB (nitropropane dioxygenase family)